MYAPEPMASALGAFAVNPLETVARNTKSLDTVKYLVKSVIAIFVSEFWTYIEPLLDMVGAVLIG